MKNIVKWIDAFFGMLADALIWILLIAFLIGCIYASYRYDVFVVKQGIEESR